MGHQYDNNGLENTCESLTSQPSLALSQDILNL